MSDALVPMKAAEDFVQAKLKSVMEQAYRDGLADGRCLERQRIATIFSHPACKGREAMAYQLAYFTDLSADAAIAQFQTAPAPAEQQAN